VIPYGGKKADGIQAKGEVPREEKIEKE